MLPALNEIAAIQAKPTLHTQITTDFLLNYTYTYLNEKIRYHTRNMILHVKLYADYLFISGSLSQIFGHYDLSCHTSNPINPSDVIPNGPIHSECKNLQHAVGSTTRAEP